MTILTYDTYRIKHAKKLHGNNERCHRLTCHTRLHLKFKMENNHVEAEFAESHFLMKKIVDCNFVFL